MILSVSSSSVGAFTAKQAIPVDGLVVGVGSSVNALISYDPNLTVAQITGGTIPAGNVSIISYIPAGQVQFLPSKIPVSAGESVFVAFSAAGTAVIYIEPT